MANLLNLEDLSGHLDLTHNLHVKLLSLLSLFFKNNSTNNLFSNRGCRLKEVGTRQGKGGGGKV